MRLIDKKNTDITLASKRKKAIWAVSTADGDLVAISIAKSLYRARAHSHLILIAKKMKKKLHYILFLFVALAFAACNEDIEEPEREVEFCVKAVWENGLGNRNTRSLSDSILANADAEIAINYPEMINVYCSDGSDFSLTRSEEHCGDNNEFLRYIPSKYYNSKNIGDLTFTATAVFDDGYAMTSTATKDDLDDLNHLRFTFHHTKALLRFAFKVDLDSRYDKIRFIRVTNINLNGSDCALVDKVLTTTNQFIAYAYIDPKEVTITTENTIRCTYNIYDKDSATDADLTRKGVVAKNTFTLSSLKDSIEAGYYYDLRVTLNPDYLYVLAEHDNKHITIN